MSNRIKGRYIGKKATGQVRYLDPHTGDLYLDPAEYSSVLDGLVQDAGNVDRWYRPNEPEWDWLADPDTPLEVIAPTRYPDGNPKSLQGAKKHSLRYLPLPAQVEVNRALADGAAKYGAANWRDTGVAASVYIDAALRHIAQYYDGGQNCAADSGVHNLGHAMACLAIIIDAEYNGTLTDDRPAPCRDTDALLKRLVA